MEKPSSKTPLILQSCVTPSQTLAEKTLEIWLSQSCALSSGKKRHICVATTSQSPNLASLSATPPLRVKRHEPQARHRALGNPAAATALSQVEVNPGLSPKRLQLQLGAWYRHIPNSLLGCSMRRRQRQLGDVLRSLPPCSFDGEITQQHPSILHLLAYTATAAHV